MDMLPPSSRNKMETEVVVGTSRMSTITSKTATVVNVEDTTLLLCAITCLYLFLVTVFLHRVIYMEYQFSLATFFDQTLYICMQ